LVDVAINIFAKPFQTALALLSLLKYSAKRIDRLYLQVEPVGSRYDALSPYAVAGYLREQGRRVAVFQPEIWLATDPADAARLRDDAYRLAIRYQYAFEHTDKQFLFILHNDVLFKRDIIGAMLERIGGAFAIGQIGQCWNCPLREAELARAAGLGSLACAPERYQDYRPDAGCLRFLYEEAEKRAISVRPYLAGLIGPDGTDGRYAEQGWPLPECRVNEWGCLGDVRQTAPLTFPQGEILPFGAFEPFAGKTLDTAAHWFRELNRKGLYARHFDLSGYLAHYVGHNRMSRARHQEAELAAENLLAKAFPDFMRWRERAG
jgi:hypothetical protein